MAYAQADASAGFITAGAIATGWLAIATVVQVVRAAKLDKEAIANNSPLDLTGCLMTMHRAVLASKALPAGTSEERAVLRMTIHRLIPDRQVEQIVEYVGGPGDGAGRTFSARGGVVGKAIASCEPVLMHRPADTGYDTYLRELRRDWHMTEEETKGLRHDRFSMMAVPLFGEEGRAAIGVTYLDSAMVEFFDEKTVEMVLASCAGLATYVAMRYGKVQPGRPT